MNQKVLKIITVLMLIATLTMANFVLLCADVVSYAIDAVNTEKSTNNKNVEFVAYLKNENGEKVNSLDAKMNAEDLKLYFQITVKQEGLFNGNIVLSDANFKFKTDFSDNSINRIEENKIYLNQINAGETKEIEVGIQLLTDSKFDLDLISKESKIAIEGTYRDSTQKNITISATRMIKINMVSPYSSAEECIKLSQEIITNKIAKYNGEDKRIIQVQVNSGINNNLVPIKSSLIKVQAPKISDKYPEVLINANNILATNGKMLTQDNWNYDKETGLATIEINNVAEDNKVIWTKNGEDKFIITYIFDKDVEISADKLNISSEINLYENKNTKVSATSEMQINQEEKDSIITVKMEQNESNIYKGKLYAGISRDIAYTTIISSNLAGVANEATLIEENQKIADKEISSIYKNTVINKENVLNVLGNNGELTILNGKNDTEIAKINANSETDKNGNITVNYADGVSTIKIKITEPQNVGDIKLVTTKTIGKIDNNIVKTGTEISTKVTGNVIEDANTVSISGAESKVGLLETETNAQLQLSKTEFSTMSTNNVEMRVVLNSRDENNDLFKNPVIRIQLPSTIQKIDVKSIQLVDEEELKIASAKLLDGNILEIKLSGEQTNYKDKAIEGAILILNMDLTLDKKLPSSEEKVILTCVNGEKTVQEQKNINFVSYAGLVTVSKIEDYGIEIINNQGNKEVTLPIQQNTRGVNTTKVENEIINNEENVITNVSVLGTFPTKDAVEGNNFDIGVQGLTVTGIEANRVQVYYSENKNATTDLEDADNAWTQNITDSKNVKKYLIKIDKLDVKEGINVSYEMQMPQSLEYNLTAKQGYVVDYANVTTEKQKVADYMTINTEKGATLDVTLKALVGKEEASTVNEYGIIRYEITISNTGSEDMNNAKITAKVPENTVLIDSSKLNSTEQVEGDIEEKEEQIESDKTDVEFDIDKIAKGETVTKYYDVKVKEGTAGNTVQNTVQLQYGDVTKNSNEVKTTIENGNISVLLKNAEGNAVLQDGYNHRYLLTVKNESDKKLKNLVVNINNPEEINIMQLSYVDDNDNFVKTENQNTLTIKEIDPNQSIVVAIYGTTNMKTDDASKDISLTAKVTDGNKEYNSNRLDFKVVNEVKGLEMSVTSDNSGDYVKAGDKIIYNITVKNGSSNEINKIKVNNWLSNDVSLISVSKNGKELSEESYDISTDEDKLQKIITLSEDAIEPGEEIKYSIEVEANVSYNNGEVVQIINETNLKHSYKVVQTSRVEHILKTEENQDNNNGDNNNNDNNNNNGNDSSTSNYLVSGIAWIDENENGQRDSNEKLLEGIKVKLLDAKTNEYVKDSKGNVLETTTNSEGFYAFTKVEKGEYLVIFEYDTTAYSVTGYKKDGVADENNSKAISKTITVDGKEEKVAVTEKIDVTKNTSGINIGLVPAKKYDMQLDKYVTKITVQNSKTVSTDYTDAKLAKQEINAKEVNSTTVVVEYTIRVTNKGEVAGYVKKIADYLSSDYKFSSELNKDWYQDGNNVYCIGLADTKINPGESKDVKLTVIKQMKENNTGLINNTAEIVSSYNELGLTDINSTEGNKVDGENDMSSADVIISIKTGEVVTTVLLVITTIIMLGVAVYMIRKSIMNKGIM